MESPRTTLAQAKEIIRRQNALIASGQIEAPIFVDPFEDAENAQREQEESIFAQFGGAAGLRSHLEQVKAEGITRHTTVAEFAAHIDRLIAEDLGD